MLHLKRLNARGFAHHVVLLLAIVIVGVGGSAQLVASKADSCPTKFDQPSHPKCQVTIPAKLSCAIRGVPSYAEFGQVINATVVITNSGGQTSTAYNAGMGFGYGTPQSPGGNQIIKSFPPIGADTSLSYLFPTIKVGYYSSVHSTEGDFSFTSPAFKCGAVFQLPPPLAPANLSCTIKGVPSHPAFGKAINATAVITNTGGQASTAFNAGVGFSYGTPQYPGGNPITVSFAPITAGASYTYSFPPLTVGYYSSVHVTQGKYSLQGYSGGSPTFNCGAVFPLPKQS